MNLQEDFNNTVIKLNDDYEGKVIATLISSKKNRGDRRAVLYLHGFIDYFYHPHVAKAFHDHQYDFFALDLRKYGRSLQSHQHPNYCKNLKEYFEEISLAIKLIHELNSSIYLLGHSTGGLIASYYMIEGEEKALIKGLILNSPFLDFYQSKSIRVLSYYTALIGSKLFGYSKINAGVSSVYTQSIHSDYYGEWNFNLNWKPINGFPTYLMWVVAIHKAQKQLKKSSISIPTLVMHSSSSTQLKEYVEEADFNDIVLNVDDIKKIGKNLGPNVTMMEIDSARHDVFLSKKSIRQDAFLKMFDWLKEH